MTVRERVPRRSPPATAVRDESKDARNQLEDYAQIE
jgi:hypothetical protein